MPLKTLISPSTGSADKVYGVDWEKARKWLTDSKIKQNNYSVDEDDKTLSGDTTNNDVTFTLPATATVGGGKEYHLHKKVADNSLIIQPATGETINNTTSYTLTAADEAISIEADDVNLNWRITAKSANVSVHTILDSTVHTDATTGSVARGDIITGQGASPKWTRKALGAVGYYLRSDGTDLVYSTIQAGDLPTGIDAAKLADGTVSNTELQYINSVTSNVQTQIDSKEATANKGIANGYTSLGSDGFVPTNQLGSGTPDNTKFLRGDKTWAVPSGSSGVDTHDLLGSDVHTDTVTGTVQRGDLITGQGSPTAKWTRKALGGANTFVKSDGSDVVFDTIHTTDIPTGISATKIGDGSIDNTEFGYLNGCLSNIQTQLDGKAATSHTHVKADITDFAHQSSHQSGGSDALSGLLDANAKLAVTKAGVAVGTRRGLNLIEGSNITLTVADNGGSERVDVTIAASAGGTTHDMLSATHTDTTAAAAVRGDVIVADSTPKWVRVPIGAVGTYFRSDGTDAAWSSIQASELPSAIDATKIADGSVSNTEFQYIGGLTSDAQTQLDAKEATANKAIANGYASLDSGALVPNAQLASAGTASATTFLSGDRQWRTPAGGGGGGTTVRGAYNLIMYLSGSTAFLYDNNGTLITSNSNHATVLNTAMTNLASGGKLYISKGLYTIGTQIVMPQNRAVHIEGETWGEGGSSVGGTELMWNGSSSTDAFVINNTATGNDPQSSSYLILKNLKFTCNSSAYAAKLLRINYTKRLNFENVICKNEGIDNPSSDPAPASGSVGIYLDILSNEKSTMKNIQIQGFETGVRAGIDWLTIESIFLGWIKTYGIKVEAGPLRLQLKHVHYWHAGGNMIYVNSTSTNQGRSVIVEGFVDEGDANTRHGVSTYTAHGACIYHAKADGGMPVFYYGGELSDLTNMPVPMPDLVGGPGKENVYEIKFHGEGFGDVYGRTKKGSLHFLMGNQQVSGISPPVVLSSGISSSTIPPVAITSANNNSMRGILTATAANPRAYAYWDNVCLKRHPIKVRTYFGNESTGSQRIFIGFYDPTSITINDLLDNDNPASVGSGRYFGLQLANGGTYWQAIGNNSGTGQTTESVSTNNSSRADPTTAKQYMVELSSNDLTATTNTGRLVIYEGDGSNMIDRSPSGGFSLEMPSAANRMSFVIGIRLTSGSTDKVLGVYSVDWYAR